MGKKNIKVFPEFFLPGFKFFFVCFHTASSSDVAIASAFSDSAAFPALTASSIIFFGKLANCP